jgi:hypothetical protein
MDLNNFTADSIRARLQHKRDARRAEERAHRDSAAAQQAALHDAFEKRELPPDALQRVMVLVDRASEADLTEVLVYRFPSEFMNDSGRSITSHVGDWAEQLTGAARVAYAFFKSDLEPRGFSLRAGIVDYKNDMPGDVGFYLHWT